MPKSSSLEEQMRHLTLLKLNWPDAKMITLDLWPRHRHFKETWTGNLHTNQIYNVKLKVKIIETETWMDKCSSVKQSFVALKITWWLRRKSKKTWDLTTRICLTATTIWSRNAMQSTSTAPCSRTRTKTSTWSSSGSCRLTNRSEQPWTEETEFWVWESRPSSKPKRQHTMSQPEPHQWEEDIEKHRNHDYLR